MIKAKFTVPGEPKGKARARTIRTNSGRVRTFTPEGTVLYENLIKTSFYQTCRGFFFTSPVRVNVEAYFSIPKSTSKIKKQQMIDGVIRPTKKPDLDNIAKCILDALNGIAYHDDSQVISLKIEKFYSEIPRVEIELQEI